MFIVYHEMKFPFLFSPSLVSLDQSRLASNFDTFKRTRETSGGGWEETLNMGVEQSLCAACTKRSKMEGLARSGNKSASAGVYVCDARGWERRF